MLFRRYRLRDLAFAASGLRDAAWLVPPLLLVTAAAAFFTHPEGPMAATFAGAAFSEQLFRLLVQSRLGGAFNPARGWFIASLAWAFVHMPAGYAKGEDLSGAARGCVRIVPLGLMWGDVTYRTGSIWSVGTQRGACVTAASPRPWYANTL